MLLRNKKVKRARHSNRSRLARLRISAVSGVVLAMIAGGTALACLDRPSSPSGPREPSALTSQGQGKRHGSGSQQRTKRPEVGAPSSFNPEKQEAISHPPGSESAEQPKPEREEIDVARISSDPSTENVWLNDGNADPEKASFYWDHNLAERLGCQQVRMNPSMGLRSYPGATFTWYYDDSGRPSDLPEGEVLRTVKESFNAIAQLRNNCGISGDLNVDFKYGGKRDAHRYTKPVRSHVHEINVSFSGNLGSAVGRGGLTYGSLSKNSVRYDKAYGNVRLNPQTDWMTTGSPGCPSSFSKERSLQKTDMQSTVMHEIMHVLNVDHSTTDGTPSKNDTDNPEAYQTMASATATCSVWERTLGRGDIARLVEEYGKK